MSYFRRTHIILLCTTILGLLLFCERNLIAQDETGTNWSEPQLLYENRAGYSRLDYMFADVSGALHLFWSANPRSPYRDAREYDENETTIFYQRLLEDDWLPARDILLRSQAHLPFGTGIDSLGTLHVMTTAGGPPCLAHLSVSARVAGNARAWPQPTCIDTAGVGEPDLAVADDDALHAIYAMSGQRDIAVISSTDGGHSWSPPSLVDTSFDSDINLAFPRLVVDGQGRLHAVWGEVQAPDGYPFIRLLYARSVDAGLAWSAPVELADGNQGDPNLIVSEDTVHAVWNGDAGYQGRYYRVSHDAGITWSDRMTLPLSATSGGLQGAPAIVVDGAGTVHILYTDSPNLYYITQNNGRWTQPLRIAGPENTGSTSEINYPMLAITEGNRLHALYTRDAQAVYYQERTIDAPYVAPARFPEPAPAATPGYPAMPTQGEPAPLPTPLPAEELTSPAASNLPIMLIIIGPTVAVVIGAVVIQTARRRR